MTLSFSKQWHSQKGAVVVEATIGLGLFLIWILCCFDILWAAYSNFAVQYVTDMTLRQVTLNGGQEISVELVNNALKSFNVNLNSANDDKVLLNNTPLSGSVKPLPDQFICIQIIKQNMRLSGLLGFSVIGSSCGIVEPTVVAP